jgi:type II secretion system protein C
MKLHREYIWIACVSAIALLILNMIVQNRMNVNPSVVFRSPAADEQAPREPQSVSRRLSARPAGASESDTTINMELWGTITGKPSMAFIFSPDTNQQGMFRLNDTVNGFRLVKISSGKIVLEKNGDAWELILKAKNSNTLSSGKAVIFSDPASGTIVVNKMQFLTQMLQAKDMLQAIKIFPISDPVTSKLGGFRVDNVPSNSLIDEVGIKTGDVIYSVQGQKLQTMQDAWSMFGKVQNQPRVEVVLMRNNEPVTIKYEIK